MKRLKRTISLALCFAMLLGYIPFPASAEDSSLNGLCEHHAEHMDCSYAPAAACTHQHDNSCYTTVEHCAHVHDGCGTEEIPCAHVCGTEEGCGTDRSLTCQHVHGDCGYAEAVACDFVCADCGGAEEPVEEEPEEPTEKEPEGSTAEEDPADADDALDTVVPDPEPIQTATQQGKTIQREAAYAATAASTHDKGNHCLCSDTTCSCGSGNISWSKWSSTTSLPSSGKYYLTANVKLSSTWAPSGNVQLCLNGNTVTYSKTSGSLLRIKNGITVTISDCRGSGVLTGGFGTPSADNASFTLGGTVYIEKGTLNLYDGTISKGHANAGCCVYIAKGNTFNMTGGKLYAGNSNMEFPNTYDYSGGGVYVSGGTFNMTGGSITNCRAKTGGGMELDGGIANLSGNGSISECIGLLGGGGIYIYSGTLNLSGNFSVKNNYIGTDGPLDGGGISNWNGRINISGAPVVRGNTDGAYTAKYTNIELSSATQRLYIVGKLEPEAQIWITPRNYEKDFTSGWSTYMSGETDYSAYFTPDDSTYEIVANAEGTELTFFKKCAHSYKSVVTPPTCTTGGYTTYTCTGCGDSYIDSETASTGHSYEAVVTPPTCTTGGYTTYTCTGCGDSYIDSETTSTGHSYEAVVTPPTCTTGGYTTHTCSGCGDSYIDNETPATGNGLDVPAKPHKIVNNMTGPKVYWKAVSGAVKYNVWRSENGANGTYSKVGSTTALNYLDNSGAVSGKTYFYKISAVNGAGVDGERSPAMGIQFLDTPDVTTRINSAYGIKLGWNKVTGATGYAVYRMPYGGSTWERITTLSGGDTLTYTDSGVKSNNGTVYKYTIRALGGSNLKTMSGCYSGRTMVRLTSQTVKTATKAGANSIKCSWTTSGVVTGYEVRFMIGGTVYKTFTVGNPNTGSKTFSGLKAGQTYDVQVRTYKKVEGVGAFYSAWSVKKNVTI